jgi:hypothetical protein
LIKAMCWPGDVQQLRRLATLRNPGKTTLNQQTVRVNTQVLTPVVLSISGNGYVQPRARILAGAALFEKTGQPFPGQAAGLDALMHRCTLTVLISLASALHTASLGGEQ